MATLLSVNVGMPKDVSWRGRTVHTGVWKSPVSGRRMVRRLNIDGDGQGDAGLRYGGRGREEPDEGRDEKESSATHSDPRKR